MLAKIINNLDIIVVMIGILAVPVALVWRSALGKSSSLFREVDRLQSLDAYTQDFYEGGDR